MENYTEKYAHLIKNLERITKKKSIINYKSGEKAFLSLGKGNLNVWLEKLLPNTRLIIEPKIIGIGIAIHYQNGNLKKVITKHSMDLTKQTKVVREIPQFIRIKNAVGILGQLYSPEIEGLDNKESRNLRTLTYTSIMKETRFCAFQILNCRLNHFQSIQELGKLNFEIPQTEFTNYIADVQLFKKYWKEELIFKQYPTCGIVLKVNSKKLQKHLGENNDSVNWAYSVY